MKEWLKNIQTIVGEIDACILGKDSDEVTLGNIADKLGYSPTYTSHKFREISGMQFRDYLRCRKLAFALKDLRDTDAGILEIALEYGFSSHEAFSRAFKELYGVAPSEYRRNPRPLVLRTSIHPFDCYVMEHGGEKMESTNSEVKVYFISMPAHKFLHIRNYRSIGYWDFWQKQADIPGQDCATICGLLESIPDKLDDLGSGDLSSGSGQVMAYINAHEGRLCSWGIPLAEAYGVRLPVDYSGPVPEQMRLMDVEEGEYIVFEHGPFDYETQNSAVEAKIEKAMSSFDYEASGYELDLTPEKIFYFYHDCERYWKYVRPVKRIK